MQTWRLIDNLKPLAGKTNMAIDSVFLNSLAREEILSTLRFYQWQEPTITLGYSQKIEEEVFFEKTLQDQIPVIRRITGGGAVFHEKELTYSCFIPLKYPFLPENIIESYKFILQPFIETFHEYSLPVKFSPINDLKINELKISGNAQSRKKGILLQHGTILLDLSKEKIFNYLKRDLKKNKIIALKDFLGEKVLEEKFKIDFISKVVNNFTKLYDLSFENQALTLKEEQEANILAKQYFDNNSWNLKRSESKGKL